MLERSWDRYPLAFMRILTNWGSEDRKVTVYLPADGVRVWVSRVEPLAGETTVAVICSLAGIVDRPSREVKLIVLGYLVAETLLTVMVTVERVELFPALSWAWAVKVWEALVRVVVSRVLLMFPEEEVAKTEPSTDKVKSLSPEVTWPVTVGSEAVAEKVIVPETVPDEGLVIEAVGFVVSGADWVVAEAEEDWAELFPAAS